MKAVLFDIDGTLVRVGGAGKESLITAAAQLCRMREASVRAVVDTMDFRGGTDALLIEALAAGLGCTVDMPALLTLYVEALEAAMGRAQIELLPGIIGLVELLRARQVQVGLLTGNVRAGARCKLRPFHLDHLVDEPGGFGDDGRSRADIARFAVRQLYAVGVRPGAVVVIGDTEHDITAARAAGAAAVAVDTGWTAPDVLQNAHPDVHVANLADPAPVLALLDRL